MPGATSTRNANGKSSIQNMIVEEDENEQSHGDLKEGPRKNKSALADDEYEDVF